MYRKLITSLKTLGFLTVSAMALVSSLEGQRSGAEIWGANCGRCHLIQPINRYDAKAWEDIGLHMAITARLTSAQTTAVIDFLKSAARRVAALEELEQAEIMRVASLNDMAPAVKDPGELFKSQCAACHGETGEGDGIAAIAYNPKPTDFTSAEWAAARTADQVEAAITDGFNAMPPFAAMLSAGDIKDLAVYLRGLSN
jgi:mono/diheme cytochrome c family protein